MRFDNGEVGWMTEDKKTAKSVSSVGDKDTATTPRAAKDRSARSTRDSQELRAVELRKKASLTSFQLKVIESKDYYDI
jgi:hypothetical protein